MKRKDLIKKLINEGFSEKILVNFNDKQLVTLSKRVINEEGEILIPKEKIDSPEAQNLKNKKEIIRTYENDESIGDDDMFVPSGGGDSREELVKWVERLSEQKLKRKEKNVTSKGAIMEIIKRKIQEYSTQPQRKESPHEKETITAPPKTKPDVKPDKMTPFKPTPAKNPKPKATLPQFMTYDSIKGVEKETITAPPKTKPDVKPDKISPFKPTPAKNPKPKATTSKKINETKKK